MKVKAVIYTAIALFSAGLGLKAENTKLPPFQITPGFTLVSIISVKKDEFEALKQLEKKDTSLTWTYSDKDCKNIKFVFDKELYSDSSSLCLYNTQPLKSNSTYDKNETWWVLPTKIFTQLIKDKKASINVVGSEFIPRSTQTGKDSFRTKKLGTTLLLAGVENISLTINGERKDLQVQVVNTDTGATLYVLDNPEAPVILKWETADKSFASKVSQLVIPALKENIMQSLQETGRVKVYGIYFNSGSAQLRDESDSVIREIGEVMKNNPKLKLCIEGHTDNIGNNDLNTALSKQRANSVKQKIVELFGISDKRLETKGLGSTKPVNEEDSPDARAQNRRVEIVRLN